MNAMSRSDILTTIYSSTVTKIHVLARWLRVKRINTTFALSENPVSRVFLGSNRTLLIDIETSATRIYWKIQRKLRGSHFITIVFVDGILNGALVFSWTILM